MFVPRGVVTGTFLIIVLCPVESVVWKVLRLGDLINMYATGVKFITLLVKFIPSSYLEVYPETPKTRLIDFLLVLVSAHCWSISRSESIFQYGLRPPGKAGIATVFEDIFILSVAVS